LNESAVLKVRMNQVAEITEVLRYTLNRRINGDQAERERKPLASNRMLQAPGLLAFAAAKVNPAVAVLRSFLGHRGGCCLLWVYDTQASFPGDFGARKKVRQSVILGLSPHQVAIIFDHGLFPNKCNARANRVLF